MSFFYDLNKKLDSIRATPEVTHKQLNERDMSRAAKGIMKYGKDGMQALRDAEAEGKALGPIRKKYDKYDNNEEVKEMWGDPYHDDAKVDAINAANPPKASGTGTKPAIPVKHNTYDRKSVASNISGKDSAAYDYRGQVEEGPMDTVKKVGKKVASGINKLVGHGSDKDMIKDLQRKSGAPVTGKKPEQKTTEAAKYRDPKYKDKLYTQEPPDYTYGPDMDDAYYNPKPDDYAGRKRKIGGGEFDHNDPLKRGQGIGRSGIKNNILDRGPRKGMPSRDQITSLKGSIKSAKGTHAEPNLPEDGAPMTAKQKSFAKLAPPADKITFADKIAGAKKEVDEMLGDVAAEAMRSALGGGKGRNAEMDEERSKGTAFDMTTPRAAAPKVGSIERGHKHDIKHTATGRMVTRRVDDQGNSVGADDDSEASGEKRGRGRPKGTKQSIGAKGPSGKSKLMTKEGVDQGQAQQVVDDLAELRAIAKQSQRGGEFPQGFASQLEVVLYAAITLIRNQQSGDAQVREEELDEKAVSKKQQKFMGMVHATQKGEKPASKEVAKAAKTMKKKDAEDFASTKHKGLPEKAPKKKKEEEVDESTTSGSVATSTATTGGKGGVYGKGIYDSMNRELETMIAESMSINMSDSTEGNKSLTVTATDDDAMKLAMMLKSAGLGGQGRELHNDDHLHGEEPCDTCGMPDCGCGDVQEAVDENSPDWPTNTETSNDALQYAGGLNKPKTDVAGDGQTTIPNTAVHTQDEDALRRMMEMAGMSQNNQLDEGIMDKLKSFAVPKLMKLLGPDAEKIASAVKQATGGDLTPNKENAMKVVQSLGIDGSAAQGQSQQMDEGIAGNWQGKLMQALYTLGLLGSAGAAASMWGTVGGSSMAVIGTLLLMFAGAAFGNEPGQVGAMGNFGNKGTSTRTGRDVRGVSVTNPNVSEYDDLSRMMEMAGLAEAAKPDFLDLDDDNNKKESMKDAADDKEEDTVEESIQRMREMAGIKEAKKQVDQNGDGKNDFEDIKIARMKASGAIDDKEEKKVDESIFALTNQWKAYKG